MKQGIDMQISLTASRFMECVSELLAKSKITSRQIAGKLNVEVSKIKGLRYGKIKATLSWCNLIYAAYREIKNGKREEKPE